MLENPITLLIFILLAAAIFAYLYFRPKRVLRDSDNRPIQQLELKLLGELTPSEIRVSVEKPVRLIINRYDTDPADEIFEIEEFDLYELLPAAHATIISFLPDKKGKFPIILGADKKAGLLIVE